MGCIREYKKPTILTLLCMVGEVAIEVLIPFFTANLVNEIKGGAERALRLARERRLCQKRPPRCFHPRAELRV